MRGQQKQDMQKASVFHARVHGEVEDMQQAADAERIYGARGRHQGFCEIFYPSLLQLLLVIASSFGVPCSCMNNQIYSSFPFAQYQSIY